MRKFAALPLCILFFVAIALAQQPRPDRMEAPPSVQTPETAKAPEHRPEAKEPPEQPPVITHHEIHVGGKVLRYTATVGLMPIRDEKTDKLEAHIFYIAYALENPGPGKRPLTFAFNGGPGSSSVWLHLGCIGPRRVKMTPDGFMPQPPFTLEDNQYTWLDQTDLVFIDPVGTGYSRPLTPELGKKFWSLDGDIASVGQFIRLYLTRYERWTSPLFIAGESYGTTRAAGLSGYLIDRGIALNGVVLVSSVLQFQTLEFAQGNDLPYILYVPTFAMTAMFHHKLAPELSQNPEQTLQEVEKWAFGDYALALEKGDGLTAQERQAVAQQLSRYTGISPKYIEEVDLRLDVSHFNTELLRDQKVTVGRLDSRYTAPDLLVASQRPDFDPSEAAIRPPFTSLFNEYVRSDLGYKTDAQYYILGGGIGARWEFPPNTYAETASAMRRAVAKNPFMKIFVAEGWYDEATPLAAIGYTLNHMGMSPEMHKNIAAHQYASGHMVYIRQDALAQFRKDIGAFLRSSMPAQ